MCNLRTRGKTRPHRVGCSCFSRRQASPETWPRDQPPPGSWRRSQERTSETVGLKGLCLSGSGQSGRQQQQPHVARWALCRPSSQHLHRSTARTGRRSTSLPSSGVRQPTWKVFLALYPERRGLWTRRHGVAAPHIPSANIRTCGRRSTTTTWWSWRRRAGEQSVDRVNQGPAAAPSPLPRHRGRYSPEHRGLQAQMSCNLQLQRRRRGPCQRPE